MTHAEKILVYMREVGPITGWEIMHKLGCMNYRGRISDLREQGHDIKTTMIDGPSDSKIASYSLATEPVQVSMFGDSVSVGRY